MKGADPTVVVMLVILMITTTVIIGTFMVSLVGVFKRRREEKALFSKAFATENDPVVMPFLFDRPSRWIAVKCSNIVKVQAALGLHNPAPCSWSEGFAKLQERKLFISPSVKGWSIIVGASLPDPAEDPDRLYHFLMRLGNQLGSVQYYCANRVLNHHAWVRVENGRIYRAYAWAGETLWNQGEPTAAEKELEMKIYEYCEQPLPFPFTARDCHVANTEKVLQLASRWSVDPMALNNQNLKGSLGIVGDLRLQSLR